MTSKNTVLGLMRTGLAACSLLLASGAVMAQSTLSLTAAPQTATLPDGQTVPMWGYTCGAVSGSATCQAANGTAQTGGWQPPLIRVPSGQPLTINLTNNLTFGANNIPTSIVIDGQLGGGLGNPPARMVSPTHAPQGTTWPGSAGGIDTSSPITFTPGSGYNIAPTVSFTGGGPGSGAQAVAALAPAPVSALTVSNAGAGYTSMPAVTINPTGSGGGAMATANMQVASVTVTSAAGSYTNVATPTVTFPAPPCTLDGITCVQAAGTATMSSNTLTNANRRVTGVTVSNRGAGYIVPPAPAFSTGPATAATTLNVLSLVLVSAGSYDSGPALSVEPPSSCTINLTTCVKATGTALISTSVASVTLTSAGSGYTSVPTINLVGGGCTSSCATASIPGTVRDFLTFGTPTFLSPAQADRVRSLGTEVASGTTTTLTWAKLKPGTYVIHSGTQPSIQHAMGLHGILVVYEDDAGVPNKNAFGTGYDIDLPVLFSEIDPVQNAAVQAAVNTAGFSETATWDGPGACKNGAGACYPPAVNYTPRYYLINGISFNRSNLNASTLNVPAGANAGKVLLRLANAGQRLHVPSLVGDNLTLLAEDGNKVSGGAKVQASLSLSAGKTFDATFSPASASNVYNSATFPLFDRQLALSTNNQRDGGMQLYIAVNGGAAAGTGSASSSVNAKANADTYSVVPGTTLTVATANKGLLANDLGIYGVRVDGTVPTGLTLNADGTFTYSGGVATSFNYCGNNAASGDANLCTTVTISAATAAAAPVANAATYNSNVASRFVSPPPGVIANVTNASGLKLTANAATTVTGGSVTLNADGSFIATPTCAGTSGGCTGASTVTFQYSVTNAQNTASNSAQVTVNFPVRSGLNVAVKDGPTGKPINDYRWIIEEDRTFWIDPKCQVNSTGTRLDSRGNACPPLPVESLGYNFHSAHMPVIATGCVGTVSCEIGQKLQGTAAACDLGNGICRTGASQKTPVSPADVHLDPNKRYFISVLPGDGINPTISGYADTPAKCGTYAGPSGNWALYDAASGSSGNCGHEMGGAQVAPGATAVSINLQQTPLPTAKIAVFVYEDDNPVNGENDAGGGVDVIAPNEPGLGGFEIKLFDQAGQLGDNTGQITYDMFNQPVSNSLAGTIDPITGLDACPLTKRKDGLIGMIETCPKYEADGTTPSPLAGQATIANLYPGLYEIQSYPAADRIARGEEWLQTNTLDGGKPHEAFIRPNEPGYFQEFGPGGFHVSIGYANPAIINARKAGYCASAANANAPCNNTLNVQITNNHMARTPDQRTFSSETYDHYAFTQCYVTIGPADAEDFAFQKCTPDGKVQFTGMPPGTFKITVFDQWNDIMLDGLVGTTTIGSGVTNQIFPVTQWRTNLYTRTFIDTDGSGVSTDAKPGLALVNTNIRYRDGSVAFFNNTDLNGYAAWNEVFPFMNWLVVETTATRFKPTWVHSVYDAGGPVDCSSQAGGRCTTIAANLANTDVKVPLPGDLRLPGAKYCDNADCPSGDAGKGLSSGSLFPPQPFGNTMGWQGLLGQNSFMEFGVKPFKKLGTPVSYGVACTGTNIPAGCNPAFGQPASTAENGGIHGMVVYASTRPFDDPSLLLQLSWEPGIPNATINLYSKTIDAQGNEVLTKVDSTESASFDDWAQGFRKGADGSTLLTAGSGANTGFVPNMNCPGQSGDSPFFATLKKSKEYLDPARKALAYQSQFKCYDGWSQLNQAQPAPYDGFYKFPSVTAVDPATGKSAKTNCSTCITNPDDGTPMLPAGKYVVEVVMPPGYELVKEEDKNILMGDVMVAPVSQQFAGFGNVFIMPDQAAVNSAYNAANPGGLNKTVDLGSKTFPRHEGDTGSIETYWPCVGALRQVPDFNSEFPGAGQAAPFAGAMRHLCDRKEITLTDESSALAKFYLFSSTHIAGHFTGTITNDFASEFDPFSPQFGEKFGPPNLPVGIRDFNGNEVARVYSDQWGIYNGLYFSSWSVNPPNPTGYAPQMSIACMNDPGPILDTRAGSATLGQMITDPSYNPAYSNFCYEQPFMPGTTTYMDTPVIPTQAFADGYNLPDTEYPDGTPVIKTVVNANASVAQGPWVRQGQGTAAAATVSFSISGVNRCQLPTNNGTNRCTNKTTITFPNGTVSCTTIGTGGPDCSSNQNGTRNSNVAAYIRANIGTLLGAGFTASGNNANVTVTANTAGSSFNGTTVISTAANLTGPTPPVALSGGVDAVTAALDLTITALGDKAVQNPHFSGPNAATSPYNQKTIVRHYGFGPSGTATLIAPNGTTTTDLTINSWSDMTISASVPGNLPSAFNCKLQQAGSNAKCGQLVITRADNGKRSIDAITVTVGGSAPWVVTPTGVTAPAGKSVKDYGTALGRMNLVQGAVNQSPIQVAIDSAAPGDLILIQPGTYRENLIMWKPVRLQGVGASSVTINADAHPAGHMDQWRRQNNCVFGLNLNGVPDLGNTGFDPAGVYQCPSEMHQRGDRIPFESIIGWDASGNGNLAQVLQEPTLMGAYEGAGITVIGRGVRAPACNDRTFGANCHDFWGKNATGGAGAFTDGSVYLGNNTADCTAKPSAVDGTDYGTSNFYCNPSRIDGVSILNSSQGGGGLFIHSWAHNLEVANTRISGNHGTLAGAINLGNGETPDAFINDGVECGTALTGANAVTPCPPIPAGTADGAAIPFQFNTNVRIHHNMLYNNASIGDALFSGTPAGGGAITVSAGGDNYLIDHNWIAGNLSTGDGGGLQHLGLSFNGTIANNVVMFNQSTNPTLPTSGGGIVIEGANLDRQLNGTECGSTTDQDCPPGLAEGTGSVTLDGNLIYGNSAESGTGGGIRIQQINGSADLIAFPRQSSHWNTVTLTNNIVANNVAGYDGGGVSLQDALMVTLTNNTIASNDTTASAGVLFKTLGAIMSNTPPPGCNPRTDPTLPQDPSCLGNAAPHGPQPSGLVTMAHTPNLVAAIQGLTGAPKVRCPSGFGYSATNNGDCMKFSRPSLVNDMFWQNRTFSVDVVGVGTGLISQQNLVALSPLLNQTVSGGCPAGAQYWDIGLRTDDITNGLLSAAANKLAITNSILSGTADIGTAAETVASATNKVGPANPVVAQICNGARMPPEHCSDAGIDNNSASCKGFNAPPGASETTSLASVFVFTGIQPTATVDEGHNWLNLTYGPLTLSRPNAPTPTSGELIVAGPAVGTQLGAYSIPAGSPAISGGTTTGAPGVDFYGNTRTLSGAQTRVDIGAVQYVLTGNASVSPSALVFGTVYLGTSSSVQTLKLNAGSTPITGITVTTAAPYTVLTGIAGDCGTTLAATINIAAPSSCNIRVQFTPSVVGLATGSLAVTSNVTVNGSPVSLSGSGISVDLTVTPSSLSFTGYAGVSLPAQLVTLTNTTTALVPVTNVASVLAGSAFSRSGGTCPATPTFTLNSGASCTIGIVYANTTVGNAAGSVTATADTGFQVGGSTTLSGTTWALPSVSPTSLSFGRIPTGRTSAAKTLTLSNPANSPTLTTISVTPSTSFARSGGTCGATLAAGTSCTIGVTYAAPATLGATTGTLTIATSAPSVTGAPVALSGTSIAIPTAAPTLGVLDNFNRANANTLGNSWYEFSLLGFAAIRVNDVTNGNTTTGTAQCTAGALGSCVAGGWAYWGNSSGGTAFNDSQAAAFTISGTPANTPSLLLKARGTTVLKVYQTGVRVRYTGTNVAVETNVNGGGWSNAATLAGTLAANDTLTAQVDNNGNVYVWKTTGATTTVLGAVPLGDTFGFGVTGAIGLHLIGDNSARVDDFAGGTVTSP